ncbi:hypothetical protein E4T66_17370 [Sinimarinibacterium sp. CAU 1509]|uniref:hypothetical protein n=1 Tax=Sinimarinibacterium sp. CAU 1509 TaxID=2562283 RepID=UPI0010AD920B|nr:hypothetical protein [Sinimarinibacterium sp. CAU 1509]TJY57181.1 hypothetical protein E4T66_17370 [Sinimarinibacterium sp. CAU 1509]
MLTFDVVYERPAVLLMGSVEELQEVHDVLQRAAASYGGCDPSHVALTRLAHSVAGAAPDECSADTQQLRVSLDALSLMEPVMVLGEWMHKAGTATAAHAVAVRLQRVLIAALESVVATATNGIQSLFPHSVFVTSGPRVLH